MRILYVFCPYSTIQGCMRQEFCFMICTHFLRNQKPCKSRSCFICFGSWSKGNCSWNSIQKKFLETWERSLIESVSIHLWQSLIMRLNVLITDNLFQVIVRELFFQFRPPKIIIVSLSKIVKVGRNWCYKFVCSAT